MTDLVVPQWDKSDEIGELAKALCEAQLHMGNVKKDADNPFFKSKYADLPAVFAEGAEVNKHGLSVAQLPCGPCGLTTILMHGKSGQWISSTMEMKPRDNNPQAVGSCLTYMRRYAFQSFLCIAAEEDDDGNKASGTAKPTGSDSSPNF